MDKLKPILEQKFWILSGLALIMPFIGWFIATKTYATGVEERETAIDGAFSSVQFSGDIPNPEWVDGASVIVEAEQKRLDQAQRNLWESQLQSMKWPVGVQELMVDVPYEGEIPSTARERYRLGYYRQLTKMEENLRAIDQETGEGVLLLNRDSYTHIPYGTWASQPPVSSEMWNAQIDVWLVKAVLDSIESINRGAEKITEAPVRQVLELTLRGGERDYSTGGGAEGSEGYGGMGGDGGYPGGEYGGNFGGEAGGAGGLNVQTSAKFDLSEELGPVSGGAGGGYGGTPGAGPGEGYGSSAAGGYGESGEGGPAGPDRYVDDEEGYPFRTRAFVLGVLMDHNELPKFMSELSRSDWPIQIIRVQMAAVNPDNLADAGRAGGRMGGRPGMTMTPGGSYGTSPGGYGSGGGFGFGGGGGSSEGYSEGPGGGFTTGGIPGRQSGMSPGGGLNSGINSGLIQKAMSDPELAEVWIGGLITLFRPIEEQEDPNATEDPLDFSAQPENPEASELTEEATEDSPEVTEPTADPSETVPSESEGSTPETEEKKTPNSTEVPPADETTTDNPQEAEEPEIPSEPGTGS
ncbi:MAG: hypothetical protein HUJ26_24540 [Planctomycetaceae bacterium]|nr:hypothetical protein [Planctomycetaceae bacterium]